MKRDIIEIEDHVWHLGNGPVSVNIDVDPGSTDTPRDGAVIISEDGGESVVLDLSEANMLLALLMAVLP